MLTFYLLRMFAETSPFGQYRYISAVTFGPQQLKDTTRIISYFYAIQYNTTTNYVYSLSHSLPPRKNDEIYCRVCFSGSAMYILSSML